MEATIHRVLLVEDDRDQAEAFSVLLTSWGYEVEVQHEAADALAAATARLPDAVLLDLGLPAIEDGCGLLRQIRALPKGPEVLMIAVTGYSQEKDRRLALLAGCDFFFVKPADLDELHDAIMTIASHKRYVRER